jgi:iron complex outermembrane receptor protein
MAKYPCVFIALAAFAVGQSKPPDDLTQASLEQLMNIEVTSVSKKGQQLSKTAAAVFVITADDIRRSGFNSLPEVLRLAPGVQVARTESGTWAISIRGFNDDFANKILVLIDGRSVYNAIFGGILWQFEQVPLESIERIEVIRGPVAAMWGSNAINGVINVITKPAASTQGGLATVEAGTEKETTDGLRYGGQIGENASYRIGGEFARHDPYIDSIGVQDSQHSFTNGGVDFRLDWKLTPSDTLSILAEGYEYSLGHPLINPSPADLNPAEVDAQEKSSAWSVTGQWDRTISDTSSVQLLASVTGVHSGDANLPADFWIADLDFHYHVALGKRNDVIWGISVREEQYRLTPHLTWSLAERVYNRNHAELFAEDEIALVPEKLTFIAGVRWGWNDVTGFETQPTARLLWTPAPKLATWAAVSQAVRIPDLVTLGIDSFLGTTPIQPGLVGLLELKGDPKARSEPMIAYEAGQRVQAGTRVSFDLSAFYNDYRRFSCQTNLAPYFVPPMGADSAYLEIPIQFSDGCRAVSYGAELSTTWKVSDRWRLIGGYSWLRVHVHPEDGQSIQLAHYEGTSPHQQSLLRSELDLTRRIQFDTALYVYGAMPEIGIPRQIRPDARLAWKLSRSVELSAGVQDALRPYAAEFLSTRIMESLQIHRNFYGKMIWRF